MDERCVSSCILHLVIVNISITTCMIILTAVSCGRTEIAVKTVRDNVGHLKPFGSFGPFATVEEVTGFPGTTQFFQRFVFPSIPLKMNRAGRLSKAFDLWSDEYFLSSTMNDSSSVVVETAKKENRSRPVLHMHFQEFVRTYSTQNHYMVHPVPAEFQSDVVMPGPLQCPFVCDEMLIAMVMWMSSGGTSSVVHTDSVDNILCLFAGQKTFVMVDPTKYGDKVTFDHPEGSYSGIDVDRADYEKYPGLADIEYHVVNLQSGDCLYIPYKWIHQVRSNGRNVAVNFWWNHHLNPLLNPDLCPNDFDPNLTVGKVTFHGFESINNGIDALREHLFSLLRDGANVDEFIRRYINNNEAVMALDPDSGYRLPLIQMFIIIDKNRDKSATAREVDSLSERDWDVVMRQVERFEILVEEASEKRSKTTRKQYLKSEL